jgi:two-component system NtrC family sensor kinase
MRSGPAVLLLALGTGLACAGGAGLLDRRARAEAHRDGLEAGEALVLGRAEDLEAGMAQALARQRERLGDGRGAPEAQEREARLARGIVSAWAAGVRRELETSPHPAPATRGLGVWACAGALGVGLFLAVRTWFQRRFLTPLQDLSEALLSARDDPERRWAPRGAPAVRALGAAAALALDDLEAARRDLGSHVEAKTAALSQALAERQALLEAVAQAKSELEAAQARLVQRGKMAALGTVAAGVAHEFNNILGGIRGLGRELLSEASGPDREALQAILRATERGRAIVDGLRTFSRGGSASRAPVRMAAAVEEVRRFLSPIAAEAGVDLQALGDPGLSLAAGPGELEQILINLVQNAIAAAPRGSRVELEWTETRGRLEVEVRDRGPGVAPHLVPRLFEPFFTTRGKEGGTGLGLAIAHGLVAALGGSLGYRERDGGGAIFHFEVPLGVAVDPPEVPA